MANDDDLSNVPAPSSDDDKSTVTTDEKKGDKGPTEQKPETDKSDKAYRKQQSRADTAEADRDETAERLAFLEGVVGESMKERMITDFVSEFGKTYPDVTAEDLKELVSSPDDFEKVAKHLQKKHEDIKQTTLAEVREVPEQTMTEEEIRTEKSKIAPDDPSRFSKWLRLQTTKRK